MKKKTIAKILEYLLIWVALTSLVNAVQNPDRSSFELFKDILNSIFLNFENEKPMQTGKEESLEHRIGDSVETIVYFQNVDGKMVLATLGQGIFLGREVPAPGESFVLGIDAHEHGFLAPKIKLKEGGHIVYGNNIHWLFSDSTVWLNGKPKNLWEAYKEAASVVETIPYNTWHYEFQKVIKEKTGGKK